MSLDIKFVTWDREGALRGGPEASVTFTFTVSDGPLKAHAEVMLTNRGVKLIQQAGKDARSAARLALERHLVYRRDPFEAPIFLRIPYWQAEWFSDYGNFDRVSGSPKVR